MKHGKFVIGVTGGIGAGKSLVMDLFKSLDYPTYNSDVRAKELYLDEGVKKAVTDLFGAQVYKGNELNREYIGSIVFNDSKALDKLNAIIHPKVAEDFSTWVSIQMSHIVMKEAAILIESGAYKSCDAVLVVSAPEDIRINRVMLRDNTSKSSVKARIDKQLTDAERESLADWIVINDGSSSVIRQVMNIHQELQHRYIKLTS